MQLTRALQTVKAEPKMLYLSQGTQAEFHEGLGDAANGVIMHTSWHPAVPFVGLLAGEAFDNAAFQEAFENSSARRRTRIPPSPSPSARASSRRSALPKRRTT